MPCSTTSLWPVWFQHNRHHPFEVALDPALKTRSLTSAVFVAKLSEVGPKPWSTRLLLTHTEHRALGCFFGIALTTGVAIFKDQGDIPKRLQLLKLVDKKSCASLTCKLHLCSTLCMSSFNVSIKSVGWLKLFWTCCAFLHCSVDILCWGLWVVVTGLWTVLLAPLAPGSPGSWLLAPGSPVSWLPWLLAPLAPGSPGSWQDYR